MGGYEAFAPVTSPHTTVIDLPGDLVPTDRGEVPVDPHSNRELVLRRLLERGVRISTLQLLLPDWRELIAEVAQTPPGEQPPAA